MHHATPAPLRAVSLGADVCYEPLEKLFAIARVERDLRHVRAERFAIVDPCFERLEQLGCIVLQSERDYDKELTLLCSVGARASVLINVTDVERNAVLRVAATTHDEADRLLARLVAGLRRDDVAEASVAMRMWHGSSRGPNFSRRVIDAPDWSSIGSNYPLGIGDQLAAVLDTTQSQVGGLALWYGPPGTGKTTAVRALARAWRSWCDVHVIVDPEALLGDPGYLMRVVTERTWDDDAPTSGDVAPERRSRLVVLEDAGELLAADARRSTGQGLSRILNVADGLVGRGLGTSLLITTNEEVGSLHPAIRRPGRCWAQLRFGRFPGQEARAWLAAAGVDCDGVTGSRSLAELYALQRGEAPMAVEAEPIGFRA